MELLKSDITNTENAAELLKNITKDLTPYLEYYSILTLNNIQEILSAFNNYPFLSVRGIEGSGKSSFKTVITNAIADSANVFEYHCSEITELDDIFLKLYRFILKNPLKISFERGHKTTFNSKSVDEQIMHYVKNQNGNLILIFTNFDKLLDENKEFKSENLQSFFEFLSTVKNIKVIFFSAVSLSDTLNIQDNVLFETRLNSLQPSQLPDFFKIFKVDIHNSLIDTIYNETKGYIFSLNFLIIASKVLELPISEILKESIRKNTKLNEYIARKIISKLPEPAKKILYYCSFFRHEISLKILKTIDHFDDAKKETELLKDYLLIEGDDVYEIKTFIKDMLYKDFPNKEKAKLHEKIADFYAEQIPLKPTERVIEISRTSMYSEKFYHYNMYVKLSKNAELNSSRTEEKSYKKDKNLSSANIKYIASTKYLPDFEIKTKQDNEQDIEKNNDSIDDDINLSDEEKNLLNLPADTEDIDNSESNDLTEQIIPNEIYSDDFSEIANEFADENLMAENLLKKGIDLYNSSEFSESTTYLKNAMSYFQNNDDEKYYLAKFTLAKAYTENFQFTDASKYLNELIAEGIPDELLANVLFELGTVYEYSKNNKNALDCYSTAINIANDNNLQALSAKIYFQMALMFDEDNDIDNALQYYLLTMDEAKNANDKNILASAYSNIASIYEEQNELSTAIDFYKKSLAIDKSIGNFDGQSKTLSALGNIYYNKNELNIALKLFLEETHAAKKTDDSYLIASAYLELGDTFFKKQNYKNSLKAYMLSKKSIDSTISTDSKNKIERRFDMIVDEIGENAYKFLLKELRQNG